MNMNFLTALLSSIVVQTAPLEEIYGDSPVVTNVVLDTIDFSTNNTELVNTVETVAGNKTNYYTRAETDDAIDALAAYYITANASGDAFATVAALTNAAAYYSGGALRTPTRNDYAVVLADESHGGAEWRYIYAIHEGATNGQWEAQYPIETNDYEALANKPSINGVTLSGNKTTTELYLDPDFSTNNAVLVETIVSTVTATNASGCTDWTIVATPALPDDWRVQISWNTEEQGAAQDGWFLYLSSTSGYGSDRGEGWFQGSFDSTNLWWSTDAGYPHHLTISYGYTDLWSGTVTCTRVFMKGGDNVLGLATTQYVNSAVSSIPKPDYSTNNTELVTTIEAVAPPPGDYAAVSNAAMSALQPSATNNLVAWVPIGPYYHALEVDWLASFNGLWINSGNIVYGEYGTRYEPLLIYFGGHNIGFPYLSGDDTFAVLGDIASSTNALAVSCAQACTLASRAATNYTDAAIASTDTSYRRADAITNINQTVAYITNAPAGTLSIELPASGETKDWIVYAYFGVDTPLALPSSVTWWMVDESYTNAIPSNTPTALYFSQVAPTIFTLSRQELKSINIPTP